MSKAKRFLSVTVAIMMAMQILMLTGCGSTANKQPEKSNTPTTVATQAPVENEVEAPTEPVTLKMLGQTEKNFDPMADITRTRINEMMNYDIQGEMYADTEKILMALTSGEEYDIIKIAKGKKELISQLIKNKLVQPLDESIEKYGPNLKEAFTEEVWNMGSSDGKKYAIFNTNYERVIEGIAIRQDWLDKLNMEVPTTIEEFYLMLKAFKEQDPGGVGSENVIPLTFNYEEYGTLNLNGLAQAFDIGSGLQSYIEQDGKLVLSMELPGATEYVAFLKKLYSEGLLDADFLSNKWSNFDQKIGSGNVGSAIMSCWYPGGQQAVMALGENSKFVYIETLKSKTGTQRIEKTGGMESAILVPYTSKKVDDVVKFANDFLDDKNYKTLVIGDEGVHYSNDNDKLMPILPAFNDLNLARWFFPSNEGKRYTEIFQVRANKVPEMGSMYDDVGAKNDKYGYVSPTAFAPSLEAVITNEKALSEMTKEMIIQIILDDKVDMSQFDVFVKDYKASGGDAITKAYNDVLVK